MFAYWLEPADRPNSLRQWRASGANQEPWAEPSRLWRPLSNRRYVPRALNKPRPRGCSHQIVGETDAAADPSTVFPPRGGTPPRPRGPGEGGAGRATGGRARGARGGRRAVAGVVRT